MQGERASGVWGQQAPPAGSYERDGPQAGPPFRGGPPAGAGLPAGAGWGLGIEPPRRLAPPPREREWDPREREWDPRERERERERDLYRERSPPPQLRERDAAFWPTEPPAEPGPRHAREGAPGGMMGSAGRGRARGRPSLLSAPPPPPRPRSPPAWREDAREDARERERERERERDWEYLGERGGDRVVREAGELSPEEARPRRPHHPRRDPADQDAWPAMQQWRGGGGGGGGAPPSRPELPRRDDSRGAWGPDEGYHSGFERSREGPPVDGWFVASAQQQAQQQLPLPPPPPSHAQQQQQQASADVQQQARAFESSLAAAEERQQGSPQPKRRRMAWGQGLARINSTTETEAEALAVAVAEAVAPPPPPPPPRQRALPPQLPHGGLLAAFTARTAAASVRASSGAPWELDPWSPTRGVASPPRASASALPPPPPPPPHHRPSILHSPGTLARLHVPPNQPPAPCKDERQPSPRTATPAPVLAEAMAASGTPLAPPVDVSKAEVLAGIDRVDSEITALERRLAKLRQADAEDDAETAEEAAAKLPPPRARPRRLQALRAPNPPVQRTAIDDTPARAVLAAVDADLERALQRELAVCELLASNQGRSAASERALGLDTALLPAPRAFGAAFDQRIQAMLAHNAAAHAQAAPRVVEVLLRRRAELRAREAHLALEYRVRQARWLAARAAREARAQQPGRPAANGRGTPAPLGARTASLGLGAPLPLRRQGAVDGVVRSAYEEQLAVEQLAAQERMSALHAVVPSQLIDPHELRCRRFASRNGLVTDPVAQQRDEARARPWSAAERRVFLDKFALYGKNFAKVSAHLERRSTAECVVFYYRSQKVDDGFTGKRKSQLKKRRQYAELKRTISALGPGPAAAQAVGGPQGAGAQGVNRSAPTAEARQEKAALAAAARAASKPAAKRKERELGEEVVFSDADVQRLVASISRLGKSFKAVAVASGFTPAQVKAFWAQHRKSHDLDRLAWAAVAADTAAREARGSATVPAQTSPSSAAASVALLTAFPVGLAPMLPPEALLAMAGGMQPHAGSDMLQAALMIHNTAAAAPPSQPAVLAALAQALGVGNGSAFSAAGGAGGGAGGQRVKHPLLTAVQYIRSEAGPAAKAAAAEEQRCLLQHAEQQAEASVPPEAEATVTAEEHQPQLLDHTHVEDAEPTPLADEAADAPEPEPCETVMESPEDVLPAEETAPEGTEPDAKMEEAAPEAAADANE